MSYIDCLITFYNILVYSYSGHRVSSVTMAMSGKKISWCQIRCIKSRKKLDLIVVAPHEILKSCTRININSHCYLLISCESISLIPAYIIKKYTTQISNERYRYKESFRFFNSQVYHRSRNVEILRQGQTF